MIKRMKAAVVDLAIQALSSDRVFEMAASNQNGGGFKLVCRKNLFGRQGATYPAQVIAHVSLFKVAGCNNA